MGPLRTITFDVSPYVFDAVLSAMPTFWDQLYDSTLEAVFLAIASYAEDYNDIQFNSRNRRNASSLYGEQWLEQLLDQRHSTRIHDNLRMDRETFLKLSEWLQDHGGLRHSRCVSAGQKLAIFLLITGQGLSQRGAMEFFQHSLETISR